MAKYLGYYKLAEKNGKSYHDFWPRMIWQQDKYRPMTEADFERIMPSTNHPTFRFSGMGQHLPE